MKLSHRQKVKRLLLATVTATSLTWCGGIAHAEELTVDEDGIGVGFGGTTYELDEVKYRNFETNRNLNGAFAAVATTNVRNNKLVINGGTINAASGGVAIYYGKEAAIARLLASGNTIEVNDGNIVYVSGGEIAYARLTSGADPDLTNFTGDASWNKVIIRGGTIGNVTGGGAVGGSANNNTIEIRGGTVSGNVIGGNVQNPSAYSTASGNAITIWNSADLANANLIGGLVGGRSYYAGNMLNVYGVGNVVGSTDGFEKINFNVNDDNLTNFSMNVNGNATFQNSVADAVEIIADPNSGIDTGHHLNLLNGSMNFQGGLGDTSGKTMNKGAFAIYKVDNLGVNGNELTADVGAKLSGEVNPIVVPPIPIPPEPIPTPFDTDFGDDGDSGESDSADDVKEVQEQHGFEIFFNTGGYRLKTDTGKGTWVRNSAGNYDLGFARSLETTAGKLYFAPVIEHGNGKYEAYLGKGKYYHQPVYGSGNTKYTAGGIIVRKVNKNGFYYEASARGGKSESNFRSNDYAFADTDGTYELRRASYNVDAPIFIGHVRLGQAKRLNKNNLLDIYGLCFYSRQWDSDTDIHYGDESQHVDFSAVNSYRLRLGYRLTTRTSKISRIYTGLAYQYENTGSSFTATSTGGIRGDGSISSSGMLELGWQIKPSKTNPWLLDFNAQGWCGHQRGGSLMAKMKKSF